MERRNRAESARRALALVLSGAILILTLYILLSQGGAWLTDRGTWGENAYTVGRIEYLMKLNNKDISLKDNALPVIVPITGGVKINDSASAAPASPHYEAYAEENFNEGVTLAHIVIENHSDFPISMGIQMLFEDMFDAGKAQNIFYLALPQGSAVDADAHTVAEPGGAALSYKSYIAGILDQNGGHADQAAMSAALKQYYAANPQLTQFTKHLSLAQDSQGNDDPDSRLVIDILFWSEYNDTLPFVTSGGGLQPPDGAVQSLQGRFTFTMNINQKSS